MDNPTFILQYNTTDIHHKRPGSLPANEAILFYVSNKIGFVILIAVLCITKFRDFSSQIFTTFSFAFSDVTAKKRKALLKSFVSEPVNQVNNLD